MLKLDLKKAFDSIHWSSIVRIMALMRFPKVFVAWIYNCISTPSFSISHNGFNSGYFNSKQGIRQGDPISSYIFILVMEVLNVLLNKNFEQKKILFHSKCKSPQITSLLFADDILLFTKPDQSSLENIKTTLHNFYLMTGLELNLSKSHMITSGISSAHERHLMSLSGLQPMNNNMCYLGLPLCSSRITTANCLPLYDKICSTMNCWANRFLSQAGRLVLIKSVISSMMVYWSMTFILPIKLINMIRNAMLRFFWTGSIHSRKIIPCSFGLMELPKNKGGLGILNLQTWNRAAISSLLNALLSDADTLWVQWTKTHNLGSKKFWTMTVPQNSSWTWRSLLMSRSYLLPFIKVNLSPYSAAKFWYAPWMAEGLILCKLFIPQQILQSGISSFAIATDFIVDGRLLLPYTSNQDIRAVWNKYQHISFNPTLNDVILWSGKPHSISSVYKMLVSTVVNSPGRTDIRWHKVLWSRNSIPRDNLMLWKVINSALLTKDRLLNFGMSVDPLCIFCKLLPETVDHLFFECSELLGLWCNLMTAMNVNHIHGISSVEWAR